jgi:hypothetical protein
MQVKTSKKACISLHFLGGIGPFQWVTAEKIKKSLSIQLAPQVVGEAAEIRFALPFSHRQGRRGDEFLKWERYSTDSVFRKAATPPFLGPEDAAKKRHPELRPGGLPAHAAWIAGTSPATMLPCFALRGRSLATQRG